MNVCARLVELANPEQILTSAQTVEALAPGLRTRDGHFVLTDLSSNGSFLLADEQSGAQSSAQSSEIHLRREEAVLGGPRLDRPGQERHAAR